MIIGIGLDLCAIDSMAEKVENKGFLNRFCAAEEVAYIESKNRGAAQSAAAIFAAKEAALKAFGTGMTQMSMKEIVILHQSNGRPYYQFTGKALAFFESIKGKTAHLSISHEKNMAAAIAVIEGE